jgi:hypothetical protein
MRLMSLIATFAPLAAKLACLMLTLLRPVSVNVLGRATS